MSDDPLVLKKILLENVDTEQQKVFAEMLAEQCAEAELRAKGHKCWMFIPTRQEYEIMAKYAENDTCPKCGTGRIVIEVYKGNFGGDTFWLKCYWSKSDCNFEECAIGDE